MYLKICKIFLISLCLLVASVSISATQRFLIVAPGESYNGTSAKTGAPLPQVDGVPFSVSIVSYDDALFTPQTATGYGVSMTANAASTITPVNTFNLSQSIGSTLNCLQYPVTVTFGSAVPTGPVGIYANNQPAAGVGFGSVTITAQLMTKLVVAAIPAETVGVGFPISVSAETATGALVTGFNGQATVTANYFGLGAVPLGPITFTGGYYYGYVTLYAASVGNVTLTITSANPAATITSAGFKVNTGVLSSLLMVAPGETFVSGTNGGTGKTGTPVTQTAGVAFNINVYAVDAFWNTIAASTTISLSSSDPNSPVFNPASKATGATGVASFIVTLKTVGSGGFQSLTATASGAATSADIIPMTFNSLVDHFYISTTIPTVTAGQLFQFNAVAMDAYNNTVTTFSLTPTLQAQVSASPLGANNWVSGNTSFNNGFGTFNARIYQRIASNANVKITSGSASGTTNNFSVNAGAYSYLELVPPGQTLNQGVGALNQIISGSPNPATVGVPYTINLYSVDNYGNEVVVPDSASITVSDIQALVNGATPPQTVTLSGGQASFGVTFRTGGNMSVYANDITDIVDGIPQASANVSVLASALSSFQLTAVTNLSNTTAGSPFTLKIIAKDQYGNLKTNYTGTVIVSSTTDWALPYESTMQVTGTNTAQDTYKWSVTFQAGDNGEKDVTAELFMAAPYVQIFASDVFNDTPTSYTGHVGFSAGITVTAAGPAKLQVLPPGVVSRPGTADGVNNTPTGQGVNSDFLCTVNLTDNWWNLIPSTSSDSGDQVSINSNDPANTKIHDTSIAVNQYNLFLTGSTATFNASYAVQSSAFQIIATDATQGSIASNTSPYIPIYTIYTIAITAPTGVNIVNQTAGVPFTISMTAYSAFGVVATGFNGTVALSAPSDYNSSEYTIVPTRSVTFTAGVAVMQVTMYRAYNNDEVNAQFGSTQFNSNSFNVVEGPATGILVLADGMNYLPGLRQVGIPGYLGYSGTPNTVEAGTGHGLTVDYVDDNYNVVHSFNGSCNITSTDAVATVNGNSLLYVATITNGFFNTPSGFILKTVGLTGQQTVTATDHTNGTLTNTSPEIPIRHTTYSYFGVSAPSTPVTAGVPFNITITAYDVYGNICDDTNGGLPFSSGVNLTDNSTSGAYTMLPNTYPLYKGQALASIQLFQAHSSTTNITATYNGTTTGTSGNITIYPNDFKRLLVTASGMTPKPGLYSDPLTMQFLMYDPSKPPFWTSGGGSNTVPVNDAAHTPDGYPFTIFACDAYGNVVTGSADVLGQTVTVLTDDQYAIPVTPVAIDEATGQVKVAMIFHTAMTGVSVTADYTNPQIQNFTTQTFTTLAGTPYGLQVLIPGLTVNNGSGNFYTAGSYWDNGIVGTSSAELTTQPFPVTIQVADIYGNFTLGNNDHVKLVGPAVSSYVLSTSFPTAAPNNYNGQIGDAYPGMTTLTAHIDVSQNDNIDLYATDIDNGALNPSSSENPTSVNIITGGNLGFLVYARDLSTDPWSNTVNVITTAAPNTFGFQVIIDSGATSIPVYGVNRLFNCTPVSVDTLTVLGGTLGVLSNSVLNGTYTTTQQSYTDATSFRIKVTDPLGVLSASYSPIIVMGANPNSVTFTVSAQSQNVRANTATNIFGKVIDSNGNPVIGVGVTFTVQSGNGVFDPNSNTKVAFAVTNSTGNAIVQFYGSYQNEIDTIKGTYNSVSSSVKIEVSVVAPILGVVSNYPNPFKAGAENTNISYLMDTNQDVTINIYNLFGDLVLTKSINAGAPGATAGMNTFVWNGKNSKGSVVGNGGYICVVQTVIQSVKKNMVRKIAVAK